MSQVLGSGWADVPKDMTEYERKVADLANRFQSVESEELRSILDQAGGMRSSYLCAALDSPRRPRTFGTSSGEETLANTSSASSRMLH